MAPLSTVTSLAVRIQNSVLQNWGFMLTSPFSVLLLFCHDWQFPQTCCVTSKKLTFYDFFLKSWCTSHTPAVLCVRSLYLIIPDVHLLQPPCPSDIKVCWSGAVATPTPPPICKYKEERPNTCERCGYPARAVSTASSHSWGWTCGHASPCSVCVRARECVRACTMHAGQRWKKVHFSMFHWP